MEEIEDEDRKYTGYLNALDEFEDTVMRQQIKKSQHDREEKRQQYLRNLEKAYRTAKDWKHSVGKQASPHRRTIGK